MAELLERMRLGSVARVARARAELPWRELERRAADAPPPATLELDPAGFDLIAEVKRRSPSAGVLSKTDDGSGRAAERAAAYARAGAAAISVLTEPDAFGGSMDDLSAAAARVDVPVMRKDFLVDPYQVLEARVAGASGVLVIVRLLDDRTLGELLDAAAMTGMFVLVEAFDRQDLGRLASVDAEGRTAVLAGLNCRDLATLEVNPGRFESLRDAFPAGLCRVAESGLARPEDAGAVASAGYDLALVGGALMQSDDPAALIRAMLHEGRRRKEKRCGSG